MFDRIFIKKNKISESSVDLGKLCEALLFYDRTDFLLDKFTAEQFVTSIELEKLKEYSEKGIINLHYKNSAIGIFQFPKGQKSGYGPMVTKSEAFYLEEYVNKGFLKVFKGDKAESDKKTIEFLEFCSPQEYVNDFQKLLESETEDISLLTSQLKIYINSYLPNLDVSSLELNIEDKFSTPLGIDSYIFNSNFKLEELTEKYSALLPNNHTLNWSAFLLNSFESSGDLNISSQFNAELFTDNKNLPYIQNRVEELVKKVAKSEKDIETFENIILEDYRPIREAINSGEKSFNDFTEIIDKSLKFKEWLKNLESDSSLLKQYYDAVIKESWIEKKVAKASRFGIFTGLGILGDALAGGVPIGSLIASASDNYLLPKLLGGWKPNQFIDSEVKSFLPKNE
ncbi:hypothetical protein [uncultured Algoriphagus sp.]|uniref:hypothetical protein n=1 Tax=uncultured Algoriphagus sp. TaxID=417365 RepID=UPI0030EDA2CD|tara:strand:- start:2324 stop:3517 length:1194 start_codon:yes stop_codon:yes gene_type:complete